MARLTTSANGSGRQAPAHRLAMTRAEAARALGVSINSFERHVQPELRIVRRGKLRLIPVHEIERWLEETRSGPWGRHDGAGYARRDPSSGSRLHDEGRVAAERFHAGEALALGHVARRLVEPTDVGAVVARPLAALLVPQT
jgi:hypothetical protein